MEGYMEPSKLSGLTKRAANLLLLLLAFTCPFGANAQGLAGIQSVGILVESLDEDAQRCGVTKDALDSAARIVLSNSKLQTLKEPLGTYLYINVTVLKLGTQCVGSLKVELNRLVWIRPGAGISDSIFATTWQKGGTFSADQTRFAHNITAQVEALTKQFVGAWLKEN